MKTLGILRHAKSDWTDARLRDFDRPLNPRGRKGAVLMGRHIRSHGQLWERILASPAARAAETVELAAQGSGRPTARGFAINWDRRIYLASSTALIDVLRELEERLEAVMIVGHNPGLEDLIFDLVPDDGSSPLRDSVEQKFPTAAFAVLELDIDHWSDLQEGSARLIHLMRPRDLDPELGPESGFVPGP